MLTTTTQAICLDDECSRTIWSRGWCQYHYNARRNAGLLRALTTEDRFWRRVSKSTGCWVWTGKEHFNGYARISVEGRQQYVHRFAYGLLVRPIPDGLHIDHLCRNRLCVRPDHLEAVSQRENNVRAIAVRQPPPPKANCLRGHAMAGENVVIRSGGRRCRTCERDKAREYARRRRAAFTAGVQAGEFRFGGGNG